MERNLAAMFGQTFDVLVIGGGVNGAAVARDAALRGFRVALVEGDDFGWGTTARSTRLIHGGLRYLEHFDFGLVREGLREREILLKTAGHLVRPLPFLTPIYAGDRVGRLRLKAGMILYDLLSYDKSMPSHRSFDAAGTRRLEPHITERGLKGSMLYYDGQVEMPERLCLENVIEAARRGAAVANYARVRELLWQGRRVTGAVVEDRFTGKHYRISARVVVNATGPWVDGLNSRLLEASTARMRLTKGIHILLPRFVRHAIVLLAQSDGRLFFAIPWREYTLVGTTDTDFSGDPGQARATPEEVAYLAAETRRVFPTLPVDRIHLAMAGVRPLVRDGSGDEGATSRRHRVFDHREEGYEGLVSVLGGKITNQRFVAEETVDRVARLLGRPVACTTASTRYPGAVEGDFDAFVERTVEEYKGAWGLTEAQVRHLARTYGGAVARLIEMMRRDPELARPLREGDVATRVELRYGVEAEMVRGTGDYLLRRTGLALRPGLGEELARPVAEGLGALLGWSREEIERDVEAYHAAVEPMKVGRWQDAPGGRPAKSEVPA